MKREIRKISLRSLTFVSLLTITCMTAFAMEPEQGSNDDNKAPGESKAELIRRLNKPLTAEELAAAAKECYQQRAYFCALTLYQQAIAQEPTNAKFHCNAGLASLKLGNRQAALAYFRIAFKLNQDYAKAKHWVAQLELPGFQYLPEAVDWAQQKKFSRLFADGSWRQNENHYDEFAPREPKIFPAIMAGIRSIIRKTAVQKFLGDLDLAEVGIKIVCYQPEGRMRAHVDDDRRVGPAVYVISLGGPAQITFTKISVNQGQSPTVTKSIAGRSLYKMAGESRTGWTHQIANGRKARTIIVLFAPKPEYRGRRFDFQTMQPVIKHDQLDKIWQNAPWCPRRKKKKQDSCKNSQEVGNSQEQSAKGGESSAIEGSADLAAPSWLDYFLSLLANGRQLIASSGEPSVAFWTPTPTAEALEAEMHYKWRKAMEDKDPSYSERVAFKQAWQAYLKNPLEHPNPLEQEASIHDNNDVQFYNPQDDPALGLQYGY